MSKNVRVVATIQAEFVQTDGGYLGWSESVDEHVKHALDHIKQHCTFGIKEGGTDWKPMKATVKLGTSRTV